ncbi:C39 family peptidase [Bacillus massilinigeriensis]|uniref:C39 family peptidase n=1 Tax=Bacillus massilionigeriensis TaxID=1805475 RepID=UPI00096B2401|nr:C39 family peptidase [Bacillus massilionigeriensis]
MKILLFFIILLFLLFTYLIIKLKKGKNLSSSLSLFIIILFIIVFAFIFDNRKTGNIAEAVERLKNIIHSPIVQTNSFLEDNFNMSIIKMEETVLINAEVISQMPELPRGCEVTSLAMLLNYSGVDVDKMTLAKKIEKDPTPYREENGKIYFGNPNDGFVGDMYTFENPGLGVYHSPIKQLAEIYLPNRIKDLTGSDFQELKIHLSDRRPVWVIINTAYKKLPAEYFETWYTKKGKIKITYKEHSVLITGYDSQYVYFNDPLTGEKNQKAPLKDFEQAWIQMGRQAITYLPKK